MKHNLRIRVSKEPLDGGIVSCRRVTVREKLFRLLLGKPQRLMILVPGESVQELAISETQEGGGS